MSHFGDVGLAGVDHLKHLKVKGGAPERVSDLRDVMDPESPDDEGRVRTNCFRERRRLVVNLRVRRVTAALAFESAMVGVGRRRRGGTGRREGVIHRMR